LLNTEELVFSKFTVVKLCDLQHILNDYYKQKRISSKQTESEEPGENSFVAATTGSGPKSDEETFAMFDAFSQVHKASEDANSHSLFRESDFEVDVDMHRLVIRVEAIFGIQTIQLLNQIGSHCFELSKIPLEVPVSNAEDEVPQADTSEKSYLRRQ
jgi:hypothetical protein